MFLNYFSIWRDIISDCKDIQDVLENLKDRNFPFSHGYQAYIGEFEYLHPGDRNLPIGVTVAKLPPFIFKKDLQPNKPKIEPRKPQGIFEKLLANPSTQNITKYSVMDNNLLLGANSLEDLLELVKYCRFWIDDTDKILDRFGIRLIYQAIYKEQTFQKSDKGEILTELLKLGAILENIQLERPTIKTIPPEKQIVVINNESVKLYPYIFQVKVIPVSPIVFGQQTPYWLVLGAKSRPDLIELIEHLGMANADTTNNENQEQNERRQSILRDVQIHVWRRDEGKCVVCGSNEKLEYDHIIPISKGGSNTARNIQLLCENCNRSKGNKIGY